MKRIDQLAIEQYGISSLILMENAGRGIADLAEEIFKKGKGKPPFFLKSKNILVVCGKGNNGGDGFVAARHLFNRGHKIQVVLLSNPTELKDDAKTNFQTLKKMKIPITSLRNNSFVIPAKACLAGRQAEIQTLDPHFRGDDASGQIASLAMTADLIIDAIFGIGLEQPITGLIQDVIRILNQSNKKILSIDIPSGINSDTGQVMNAAVKASVTGTLHALKIGLSRKPASNYAGKIEILDISIPRFLLNS